MKFRQIEGSSVAIKARTVACALLVIATAALPASAKPAVGTESLPLATREESKAFSVAEKETIVWLSSSSSNQESQFVAWGDEAGSAAEAKAKARNRAILKVVGAFIAESARRDSIEEDRLLKQIVTTVIRNRLVESAIRELFPQASSSQVSLMSRYVTQVMEGNFRLREFATGTAREGLVQGIKKENPNFGAAAEFADFLYDLYKQRQGTRR